MRSPACWWWLTDWGGHVGFELLCWNLNPARTLIKVRLTFSTATPTSPFPLFRDSLRSQTQFIFQQPPPTHTDAYLPPILRGLESPHSTSVDNWTPSAWEIPRRKKTGTRRCRLTSGLSNISTTVRMRRRQRLGRTFTTSQIWKKKHPFGSASFWFNSHFECLTSWALVAVVQDQQEKYPHPQAPGWSCPRGT